MVSKTILSTVFAVCALTQVSSAVECGQRIRKQWESLTATEQQTYLDAMAIVMRNGNHAYFAMLHHQMISQNEAHNTCGFFLWHRRFLLAYENMLRSLGDNYACITIPYWNYYSEYALALSGKCKSFEGCSNYLQAMGGGDDNNAPKKVVRIGNEQLGNFSCASLGITGNFCEDEGMDFKDCAKCFPRGNWKIIDYPAEFSYSTLISIFNDGKATYHDLVNLVSKKSHNKIHGTSSRSMATLSSPVDPIFYGLHSFVDMLQVVHMSCNVGRYLEHNEILTNKYAFEQCKLLTSTPNAPTITSNFTMLFNFKKVGDNPIVTIPVEEHPAIGKFFKNNVNYYYEAVDAGDLGDNTYSYELSSLMSQILFNDNPELQCAPGNDARRLTSLYQQGAKFSLSTNNKIDVMPTSGDVKESPNAKAEQNSINMFNNIFPKMMEQTGGDVTQSLHNIEKLECLFVDKHFHKVQDYDAYYRAQSKIPDSEHSFCWSVVQEAMRKKTGGVDLQSDDNTNLANWEGDFTSYFKPKSSKRKD